MCIIVYVSTHHASKHPFWAQQMSNFYYFFLLKTATHATKHTYTYIHIHPDIYIQVYSYTHL